MSEAVSSKATTTNPKDLVGNTKVSLTKLPAIAVAQGAMAMMDGAEKYGPYNWRDKEVIAGIYVDAALRHLQCWFEGQECASDSKVHHLGHAIACCAILLDAQAKGKLVDNRPKDEYDLGFMEDQLAILSNVIKEKKEATLALPEATAVYTHMPKEEDTKWLKMLWGVKEDAA
jgi:hypothetical protein